MEAGNCVRDYVFESKIGQGGMGEVWSARHELLDRRVAIKVMAAHLMADPEFEARFIKEAQAQARLQHPSIIGATDFFREQGRYYLVMPLIEGQSLEEKLASSPGPLPVEDALRISADVLSALDYAHQRAVIHRDVKPSNILLDGEGRAYLTDFGIALMMGTDRRTRTGVAVGTVHYMSPEQIRRPKSIDHRTDVYSFGCVLYEMLTGHAPFEAEDAEQDTDYVIKDAHIHQQPESVRKWNSAVPETVDAIVLKSLAKEPNERFVSCGEFARAIEGYHRSESVSFSLPKKEITPAAAAVVNSAPTPRPQATKAPLQQTHLSVDREFLIESRDRGKFLLTYLLISLGSAIVVFLAIREINGWFYNWLVRMYGSPVPVVASTSFYFLMQSVAGLVIGLSQWLVLRKYVEPSKWWMLANQLTFITSFILRRVIAPLFINALINIGLIWRGPLLLFYIFSSVVSGSITWFFLYKYTKTKWPSFLAGPGSGIMSHLIHFVVIAGFGVPLLSPYSELVPYYLVQYGISQAEIFTTLNFLLSLVITESVTGSLQAFCFIRSKNLAIKNIQAK